MTEQYISLNLPTLLLVSITLLAIGACFFLAGYILGSQRPSGVFNSTNNKPLKSSNLHKPTNISIDETKIVTKIKTDHLEKKYDSLGDKKETQEDIIESVNKLKNLKK